MMLYILSTVMANGEERGVLSELTWWGVQCSMMMYDRADVICEYVRGQHDARDHPGKALDPLVASVCAGADEAAREACAQLAPQLDAAFKFRLPVDAWGGGALA